MHSLISLLSPPKSLTSFNTSFVNSPTLVIPSKLTLSFTSFLQHPPSLCLGLKTHFSCSVVTEEIAETSNEHLEYVEIGYISDVHGLQGEIRVKHNTDFPNLRFATPGKRWLRQRISGRENVVEVELMGGRSHPGSKSWIVKLSGFDCIDQAKQLVGATFLVKESDRPELEEEEFYSRDLIGMRVILKDTGETIGNVVNVFYNGGNDLLHVMLNSSTKSPSEGGQHNSEVSESGQLVWVPFVEAIVPDVDLKRREMHITPPKGLLKLNIRSDERSKKERRLLEWKERKKFQRRLIAAKKKLCELEQQHIFHGLRYGEKSQRSLLADQIVSLNTNLLQQALQSIKVPSNEHNEKGSLLDAVKWKITRSLSISKQQLSSIDKERVDTYCEHMEMGHKLFYEGKVATVLVLSTGNLPDISKYGHGDYESEETSIINHVESLLLDTKRFAENRASVPVVFISPAHIVHSLEELFSSHDHFGFDPEKVRFLEETKLPVVNCLSSEADKNKVLMKSPWQVLESSVGSGGIITALASSNTLDFLFESGVEYVELCNVQGRCLYGNPIFLGFMASSEADIGVMTFKDEQESHDNFHVVLPVKSMKKLVNHIDKLPFQATIERNSYVELVDKEWVDIIPSDPNSYEFKCSIDGLFNVCPLEKACMMEVTD